MIYKNNTMKKFSMIALSLMFTASLIAQDNFTIKSSVKMDGLPEEYAAFAESDKTVMMKGNKSKTETTTMMSSSIELFDGKTTTMLQEYMGNKSGWTATMEEVEAESKDDTKKDDPKPVFEKTSEKKMIAGYECVKTIVKVTGKDNDKKDFTLDIHIWHTDKIKKPQTANSSSNKPKRRSMSGGGFDFKEISGYPMQIEFKTKQQGMDLTYIETVSEVSTAAIDDSEFNVSTDGYKMMTYKEMKEQMKKMAE